MANCIKVLEQYYAIPETADDGKQMSLPLTFLDIIWTNFPTVERLIFYKLPDIYRNQFLDIYVPKLKQSLSSTLKDFLPLAGNLILPSNFESPEIRNNPGDGASIVFAESLQNNFEYLIANYPRNSQEFYPFLPQLISKRPSTEPDTRVSPVLAVQVTLFPDIGLCLGFKIPHELGDARSIFDFMKTWALRSKLATNGGDEGQEEVTLQPIFDRSVIKDPKGLASLLLNQLRNIKLHEDMHSPSQKNKIRQTFVLSPQQIQRFKNMVRTKRPNVKHLSTFTVTCAYIWTCLAKYSPIDFLLFPLDCRGRVNPPIPLNYFGNCLTCCLISKNPDEELVGDEGFCNLVDKIGEGLHKKLRNKDDVLGDAEKWITFSTSHDSNRAITIAGSPKFNYYDLDFGWGKPIKTELISTDKTRSITLSGCRDDTEEGGGIEICISTFEEKLEAFSRVFHEVLLEL